MATTKKPAAKKPAAKKPAAKKPAAKKPAAKKPAAKKPAAKKPAAKKPAAKSATRSVAKVSPLKGKTVEWYIAQLEPWQSDLAQQLAALVTEVAPEATHGLKWSRPVWEHAGPFAWVQASKNHVTFGLWRGADIDDPDGVLEGSGDRMRHLKIARGESVPRALGAMVRQALALNAKHGDPTKRGDRS